MNNKTKEDSLATSGAFRGVRRLALVAVSVGLSVFAAYLFRKSQRSPGEDPAESLRRQLPEHIVDDRGTGQQKAASILLTLRDRAFDASDEKLALALGRPIAEVVAWNEGREVIDDDVVMKARRIAMFRGVRVE